MTSSMPAAYPEIADASVRDEQVSTSWSFTVVHQDRSDPKGTAVLHRLDELARLSPQFVDSRGDRDRMSWQFLRPAYAVLEAMHGLVLREAPHWWAVQTTVGDRS